ncbi:unnamed protein product [Urochloa humidicola]
MDSERSNGDGHLPLAVSPLPLWQHRHLLLLDLRRHDELLLCMPRAVLLKTSGMASCCCACPRVVLLKSYHIAATNTGSPPSRSHLDNLQFGEEETMVFLISFRWVGSRGD